MSNTPLKALVDYLSQFITPNRLNLIDEKLNHRTNYITPVLEDIFDPHNNSAVIRTAEALGVQDIHIIENRNPFKMSKGVSRGSHKWVNVHQYNQPNKNNSKLCINKLKEMGYTIYGATPHEDAFALEEINLSNKVAVCFGSEKNGLSNYLLENCDQKFYIPMTGFTESLNISVSAAITMHHLMYRLKQNKVAWQISEEKKLKLKYQWLRKSLKRIDNLEKDFFHH